MKTILLVLFIMLALVALIGQLLEVFLNVSKSKSKLLDDVVFYSMIVAAALFTLIIILHKTEVL